MHGEDPDHLYDRQFQYPPIPTKPSKNREIKRKNEKESEKALKKLLAKEYSIKQKAGQQIAQERQTTELNEHL